MYTLVHSRPTLSLYALAWGVYGRAYPRVYTDACARSLCRVVVVWHETNSQSSCRRPPVPVDRRFGAVGKVPGLLNGLAPKICMIWTVDFYTVAEGPHSAERLGYGWRWPPAHPRATLFAIAGNVLVTCSLPAADSRGRRNRLGERLTWCNEAESLSRPRVERAGDLVLGIP